MEAAKVQDARVPECEGPNAMGRPIGRTRLTTSLHPPRLSRTLFLLFLLTLAGCKVNYSFSGADVPAGASTYDVAVFEARAPLSTPRTAQVFTETLRDLLQAQTPLKLVRESGDLRYEGAITGYDVQPVSIQANETAALNRLTMTVSVTYTNSLDATRSSTFTVSRFADYDSAADLVTVEEGLVRTISDQLVQDIFDRTLGNW
ncbi:MAG TPA: LptE family protein [Flavobacteriales bacterium]|nr:LptE family protein [Flavobacteriales bacterium]HQW85556.1 LptE family protein [Flavobacteriales bacterium]